MSAEANQHQAVPESDDQTIEWSSLLVRPERLHDELHRGYLLRLAHSNGLSNPDWIQRVNGCRVEKGEATRVRWCPRCLSLVGAYWQHSWGTGTPICLHHRCWLADHCAQCGRRLTWRTVRYLTCSCGHALKEGSADELPVSIARILEHAVEQDTASTWWWQLEVDRRWRLASFLGALFSYGLRGKPFKKASGSDMAIERELVSIGATILTGDKFAIHQLLSRIRIRPSSNVSVQTLDEAFPTLLVRIRKLLPREERDALIDQLHSYLSTAARDEVSIVWRNSFAGTTMGAAASARMLRVRPERVGELLTTYGIKIKARRTESGRRMLAVAQQDLETIRHSQLVAISGKAAKKRFGLSLDRQASLVDAGLILMSGTKIDSRSISNFLSDVALRHDAKRIGADTDLMGLDQVLRTMVPVTQNVVFFRALLDGKIAVRTRVPMCQHVRDLEVSRADTQSTLAGSKKELPSLLGIPDLAARLGFKEEVAYQLVNAGLIRATLRKVGRRAARYVSEEEMLKFSARYETLTCAAARAGISRQGALGWARTSNVKIVSGPGVDGGRQYFVQKA